MGSSQIYAQICSVKTQIVNKESKIKQLEQLLDNQNSVIRKYASQKTAYTDQLENQNKIYNRVSEHTEKCMIAKRYRECMHEDMSSTKRNNIYDRIDEIERLMKSERDCTQNELNVNNNELSSLRSTLSRLEAEYQSALRSEEAARRAEEAARRAAAQQNQNGRN